MNKEIKFEDLTEEEKFFIDEFLESNFFSTETLECEINGLKVSYDVTTVSLKIEQMSLVEINFEKIFTPLYFYNQSIDFENFKIKTRNKYRDSYEKNYLDIKAMYPTFFKMMLENDINRIMIIHDVLDWIEGEARIIFKNEFSYLFLKLKTEKEKIKILESCKLEEVKKTKRRL